MLRTKVLPGLAVVMGVAVVASGLAIADDPITIRKGMMKDVGGATKQSVQMIKGEIPFDAAKAKANMDVIANWNGFASQFPKGTETGNQTTASPKVWQTFDDFDAKGKAMAAHAAKAAAAASHGLDAFKVAFGEVSQSCRSCHQDYRTK